MSDFKKVLMSSEVLHSDMSSEQTQDTVEIITASIDKHVKTQDYEKMAQLIKEGCDKKFGPTWHCCVGEGFGFEVTHHAQNMVYMMYGGNLGVVLYKC